MINNEDGSEEESFEIKEANRTYKISGNKITLKLQKVKAIILVGENKVLERLGKIRGSQLHFKTRDSEKNYISILQLH